MKQTADSTEAEADAKKTAQAKEDMKNSADQQVLNIRAKGEERRETEISEMNTKIAAVRKQIDELNNKLSKQDAEQEKKTAALTEE